MKNNTAVKNNEVPLLAITWMQKKVTKENILCDSNYVKLKIRLNHGQNAKNSHDFWRGDSDWKGAKGFLGCR